MDKVRIENLELYAKHGVYPEENKLGQLFIISVDLYTDVQKAARRDDIRASVNYGEACHFIKSLMEDHTFKLIETVADFIAEQLLIKYPLLKTVMVEVKKPNAPILLHVEYVSVVITRGWHKVYLGIGGNQGDVGQQFESAIEILDSMKDTEVLTVSDFITTKPYGDVKQEDFLNGVLCIKTLKEPLVLLESLHKIEAELGRVREVHWGPRTIDLDILLYDDFIMDTKELTIPHYDMANRTFVLEPFMEIGGYERHPVYNKTICQLYSELIRKNDKG